MNLAQAIKKYRLSLIFLLVLIFGTYINSLNNAFLSDDLPGIVNNPDIGNLQNAISHYSLRLIFYWFAFHIGGLNPFWFRLINLFFHTGSVLLIFLIFNKISSKRLALFVASIFAIHPAIAEAVVWISGGDYPQFSFFFLLSFLFYLMSETNKKYYLASIISFFVSLSHPQSLSLVVIFPLWEFLFGNIKKNWKKFIPFFLITIFFFMHHFTSISERETTMQTIHYQEGGIDNLFALIPTSISSYFELIFFPKELTLYHSELAFGLINFIIRVLITLLFLAGLLICFKRNKFIFFWSLFFLIALSPTLTPFRLNWAVAERYLYLPIVGILAIVGLGFDKLVSSKKFRQLGYILFALTIILLSFRTIVRNIDWKNEDNLWIATGKTSPSSPNNHNNLGDVYGRNGDKLSALREFQRAIELKPNYGDAYHNLANTYRELNQPEKALENYQNALKYNPNLWQSYQNIGAIYFEQKKFDLALLNFQKAAQINPKNLSLQNAIGIVYLSMGDKNKAREIFEHLLNFDPNNQMLKQELLETNK